MEKWKSAFEDVNLPNLGDSPREVYEIDLPPFCFVSVTMGDIIPTKLYDFQSRCNQLIIEKQKASVQPGDPSYDMYAFGWETGQPYGGAIGGFFSWVITDTSIGQIVKIRCDYVGLEEDITNYDRW